MMKCPGCQSENKPGRRFCAACGQTLPAPYTPRHLAEKILISKSALEGESKPVTVLFCDIANSTALAERLGAEAMHAVLNGFFELALAEVHRFEGTINQFLGDGFMALFGAPLAQEEHARHAALAALGIRHALKERLPDLALAGSVALSVRAGLNTGTVVVGKIGDNLRMDYTAVGDTTNLAARLQQLAEPGDVYLSEVTRDAIHRFFDLERVGVRTVKGKVEPVTVYRLLGSSPTARPRSTEDPIGIHSPLVGRDRERADLLRCVERVRSGRGGIVSIMAEAGLGKSRLVAEARRQAAGDDLHWLEGRALTFSKSMSYLPFLEVVRSWAGIGDGDGEENWSKLERRVAEAFPADVAEILPPLAKLLSLAVGAQYESRVKYLDAQAIGRQIFRTSRRLFERIASERPLVLVFEDWHWADASSAELLEHILPLTETSALLVCCVGRPDQDSPAARLAILAAEKHADRHLAIALAPLDATESARLVQNLLAVGERTDRLPELVLRKAEGNPFFMEEVVRSLIAMRAIVREEATGRWRATTPLEQVSLPDTVHGVIMARIDRLDENLKQVLKLAAVVGRNFLYRVLRMIAEDESDLDQDLAGLQRVDLIRERRRVPELEYMFKHALVQETTYASILTDRRRYLHRRVAECIESLFADRRDEFASLLAYHFVRAEDWQKAQEYLFRAGDHAANVAADAEALAHYEQAAAAYARVFGDRWDPLQRAIFERKMGEALLRRGEHQRASEYLQRALGNLGLSYPTARWRIRLGILRQIVRQVKSSLMLHVSAREPVAPADAAMEERVRILIDLSWILYFVDPELLLLNTLTCLNVSERAGSAVGASSGAMPVGLLCDMIGWHGLASGYHRRALSAARRSGHPATLGFAYLGLAMHEQYVGHWPKAIECNEQAGRAYTEAGDLRGWGATRFSISHLHAEQGMLAAAAEEAEEMIRIGRDGADHQIEAWGQMILGRSRLLAGNLEGAAVALNSAAEMLRAIPDFPILAWAYSSLGQLHLRQGRLGDAMGAFEEGNRIIAQRSVRAIQVAFCKNALTEGYLAVAEREGGARRGEALLQVKRACGAALRESRIFSDGLPAANRQRGSYEWLKGSYTAADTWWCRSMTIAEQLGARYELGLTFLEVGKRTGQRPQLERAEAIFAEAGAGLDLAATRSAMQALAAS